MVSMIPYGQLEGGNYGINVDETTGITLASVVEIFDFLPAVADADNFGGRMAFERDSGAVYNFAFGPPRWVKLDGVPVRIESVNGVPPMVPTPPAGDLLYDTDTEVLFLFTGVEWFAVGGRYAASIITTMVRGDGLNTIFPLGTPDAGSAEYVEIFWDGVRQYPNSTANPNGGYDLVGGNVIFNDPLPTDVIMYTRTTVAESFAMIPNSTISQRTYKLPIDETVFAVGDSGVHPDGIFVYVDGIFQSNDDVTAPNYYTVLQHDTTINSITRSSTVARATTKEPHGLNAGNQIVISGIDVPEMGGDKVVDIVISSTIFEYTVPITAPSPVSGDPVMFFTPQQTVDKVKFNTPILAGSVVSIKSIKNAVVSPDLPAIVDANNIGFGVGVYAGKTPTNLQFKSILAGDNVIVESVMDDVKITALSGSTSESRAGVNTSYYALSPVISYVGVLNTIDPTVTINIDWDTPSAQEGRRVVVKDETGTGGGRIIVKAGTTGTIDGSGNTYTIPAVYGSVTLVKGGGNRWFITSKV